jgi:23S rRNA (cytosine1962-C5)-methyltransferase
MKKWVLKKPALRRFESGHPWVFSNEVDSVKGIDKGEVVDLHDSSGRFLARGFGNSASLIAFRSLEHSPQEINLIWLVRKILERRALREKLGLRASRRILHGEVDGTPGLVLDEFVSESKLYWVFHIHSAGMERLFQHFTLKELKEQLQEIAGLQALIVRRDSRSRELEGLNLLDVEVIGSLDANVTIDVDQGEIVQFKVNFKEGQKGGFFLDQRKNVEWLRNLIKHYKFETSSPEVLDAFCYCGQWGLGIAREIQSLHLKPQVIFSDASEAALESALQNASQYKIEAEMLKLDLVETEWPWINKFDLVVCDPAALIKSKKHYFAGRRAYLKVFTRSLRALKKNGIFVFSSCSFHLSKSDLVELLAEAQAVAGCKTKIFHEFSLPPDHLRSPNFPEGDYLKGLIGVRE